MPSKTTGRNNSLVEAFRSQETRGLRSPMVGELDRVVTEMERSAGA